MSHGLNVLVVDCDPQANATAGLGIATDHDRPSLADILENEVVLTQENRSDYIQRSDWNIADSQGSIEVLRAHPRLTTVETHLGSDPIGAFDRLARALEPIAAEYDIILFDCPPSVGLLTINALFASDKVIVVSAPSAWSSDGVEVFTKNIDRISSRRNGKPEIAGIIVNNVGRTRDGRFWESEIIERYKNNVVSVASRAAIAEASAMSSSLSSLGARPGAADAFTDFENVFLALIGLNVDQSPSVAAAV